MIERKLSQVNSCGKSVGENWKASNSAPYGNPFSRGAYPEYTFANETKKPPEGKDKRVYQRQSRWRRG